MDKITELSVHCEQLVESASSEQSALATLEQLWRRCIEEPTSAEAWEDFLHCCGGTLMAIVRRVATRYGCSGSDAAIEDTYQEVCLKISRKSGKLPAWVLESEASAQRYLSATATNAAIDAIRHRVARRRDVDATVQLEDRVAGLADSCGARSLDHTVLLGEIDAALEGSERDRSIFWLYYKQGFTAQEIACIVSLDLTAKGVESVILRMIERLRLRIGTKKPAAKTAQGLS